MQPPIQTPKLRFILGALLSPPIGQRFSTGSKEGKAYLFFEVPTSNVFLYSCIYTHDPEAEHGQARPDVSCSSSAAASSYAGLVSSVGSGAASLDSGTGLRGPCGVPNRVENICRWHSSQKQKYEKWPSSRSLWTVAPGTILRTNSVADGGTTRSSIPC